MTKHPDRFHFLRHLFNTPLLFFQQYPLLFWGSVWSVTLFLIWIALASLTLPPVGQPSPSPVETVSANPVVVPPVADAQTLNFWMFALIILGCAGGSLLILKRWDPKPASMKSAKRLKRKSNQALVKTAGKAQPRTQATGQSLQAPAGRSPHRVKPSTRRPTAAAPDLRTPVVTVVPAEESHPLDWGEASLAEMMDIRKRRPRPTAIR